MTSTQGGKEVLPNCALATSPLSAVYAPGKQVAPRVRTFLGHMVQQLRQSAGWRHANRTMPAIALTGT